MPEWIPDAVAVWFPDLIAFGSVIIIDLALAGDNALIVGMIAAGVPLEQRKQVLIVGIGLAMVCRILFSLIAVQLLAIIGLLLAGGLLLLWVAWKMWRDMRNAEPATDSASMSPFAAPFRTRRAAIVQIGIADISMSLDNVLAVAGAARHNMYALAFGLLLSVVLMGVAAGYIARLVHRYTWLNYVGIIIVAAVAISMIYEGGHEVIVAIE